MVNPDRAADVVLVGSVAVVTGFFPVNLEAWVLALSGFVALVYYGTKTYFLWRDRK